MHTPLVDELCRRESPMKPIVLHAPGSTSLSYVLPSFSVETLLSCKDGSENGRRLSRIDDTSQMTCRSHTEKKKLLRRHFCVDFYRIFFVSSSLPLISSALIPLMSPDIPFFEAVNGSLHFLFCEFRDAFTFLLCFLVFSSFLVCFFVRFFTGFQLCVVRRLHLTVSASILVLLHIRVQFAVEFPEDIGNAFSGCDDFILFVTYFWNECFLPRCFDVRNAFGSSEFFQYLMCLLPSLCSFFVPGAPFDLLADILPALFVIFNDFPFFDESLYFFVFFTSLFILALRLLASCASLLLHCMSAVVLPYVFVLAAADASVSPAVIFFGSGDCVCFDGGPAAVAVAFRLCRTLNSSC